MALSRPSAAPKTHQGCTHDTRAPLVVSAFDLLHSQVFPVLSEQLLSNFVIAGAGVFIYC